MSFVSISTISTPLFLSGPRNDSTRVPSFTAHGAITITGDGDFTTQGWPGDGSPMSPYIIESLEIVTDGTCISISNTDAHFIIRNCTLSSPIIGVGTGIYLSHVDNGTIENCTISSLDTGIESYYTNDCIFSNNTLKGCGSYGIYLYSGLNCTVNDNRVFNLDGYGFFLVSLRYSLVEHNNISNCKEMGFALASSLNASIVNNEIEESGRFGLYLTNSLNCTFTNNTLENGGFGVGGDTEPYWFHNFSENTVNGKSFGYFFNTNNTEIDGGLYGQVFLIDCFNVSLNSGVFFNASVGVSLFFCINCTISNAVISENLYGINLLQSEHTTLVGNSLIDCGVRFDGIETKYWIITETGNFVNGKQFGYFHNQNDLVINGNDYGQLVLVDSNHLSITNGSFNSVTCGFVAYSCLNCSIKDASFVDNYRDGILLLKSNNCTLVNVTSEGSRSRGLYNSASNNTIVTASKIHGNGDGISVSSSDNFLFDSNQIYNNRGNPIYLSGTFYGIIENNSIHNNDGSLRLYVVNYLQIINNTISESLSDGIYMDFTSGVVIVGNKIYGNTGYGLNVRSYALFSEIYDNMIGFNTAGNAMDLGLFDEWDDGAGTGNVWSDYSGTGDYFISGMGVDHYPLGFVSRPADVQYIVGAVVPAITWDVRLPNPDSYALLWDGVVIAQGSLNSSLEHLVKPIEGLPVDSYNLTLVVNDASGYNLVDTVIIIVVEESVTTTTTTTTSTTTTTLTTTTTVSTTSSTTTSTLPPSEIPMVFVIMAVGVIGVFVVLIIIVIRKR